MSVLLTPTDVTTLDDLPDGTARFAVNADDQYWIENTRANLQQVAYSGRYEDLTNLPFLVDIATSGSVHDLVDFIPSEVASTGAFYDLTSIPLILLDGNLQLIPTASSVDMAISTAINELVNSAPGTLDTLGEIAAALAADESAASALATTVGGKVSTSRTVNGHALSADVTISKSDVGLGNVDNTADTAKPVSTAQATAIALKSAKASFSALSALAAHGVSNATGGTTTTLLTNYNLATGVLGLAGALNDANTAQNDLAIKYNDLVSKFNTVLTWLGTNKDTVNSLRTAGLT